MTVLLSFEEKTNDARAQSGQCPFNKPFSNCPKPLFQSEAKCKAIDMKTTFYSHTAKTLILTKKVLHRLVFKSKSS